MDEPATTDSTRERNLVDVTKQATGVVAYQIIGLFLGFGLNFVFARVLGADLLGVFVLAQTTLLLLSLLASFGMGPTLLRFIPMQLSRGDRAGAARVFLSGSLIAVAVGAVMTVLLLLGRNVLADRIFNEPRLLPLVPIVAAAIVPAALMSVFGFALRAVRQASAETFSLEIVFKVAKLAIFLGLYAAGLRLVGLTWALAAAHVVAAATMLAIINRRAPFVTRGPRAADVAYRALLPFSVTMTFVAFMNYSLSITDRTMLGILSTSEAVGIYNIAFLITNTLALVFMAFNSAFAPLISELYHNGRRRELGDLYASLTRTVLIVVTPALIWMVGFGDDLLGFFGRDFVAGYAALVVLGFGALSRCAVGPVGTILVQSGHQNYNAFNIAAVTAANIGLNLYYIPRYGVLGAAIATAAALTVINLVGLVQVRVLLGIWPYRRSYLKLVAASAVALAANILLRANTPNLRIYAIAGIFAATYAAFLGMLALMGFEEDDRLLVRRARAKLLRGRG
ncbi:MAG: oligosaccharide flippase family protein [Candidatus Eisenbacteria bacterium]|nr:oligosaccharide flippase family protein [Candidatus Eisenbacteria bacterium]